MKCLDVQTLHFFSFKISCASARIGVGTGTLRRELQNALAPRGGFSEMKRTRDHRFARLDAGNGRTAARMVGPWSLRRSSIVTGIYVCSSRLTFFAAPMTSSTRARPRTAGNLAATGTRAMSAIRSAVPVSSPDWAHSRVGRSRIVHA